MPGPQGYNVLDCGNYLSLLLLDSGHTHPVEGAQTDWLKQTLAARQHVSHVFPVYHVPAGRLTVPIKSVKAERSIT